MPKALDDRSKLRWWQICWGCFLPENLLDICFAPSKYESHHNIWECSQS